MEPSAAIREHFGDLIDASGAVVTVHEADGTFAGATASVERVLGYDPETIVGRDPHAFVHPDEEGDLTAILSAADDAPGEPVRGEKFRVERADGTWAWLDPVAKRLDASDDATYVLLASDVTDHVAQERRLERATNELEQLHHATNRLSGSRTIDECYEIAIDAAVTVLGFDWCTIGEANADAGRFEVRAISEDAPLDVGERAVSLERSVAGRVLESGESVITTDVRETDRAEPTHEYIRAGLTVPIGDRGVFQALSTDAGAFDDRDRRLAELLIAPMATAIDRIEGERALRSRQAELARQKDRIEALHAVATDMKTRTTREAVYEDVIEAVEEILEFDICTLDEREDDVLIAKVVGSDMSATDYHYETPMDETGSVAVRTLLEGRTYVIDDYDEVEYATAQSTYRSLLSVPLEDWGVFQAGSERTNAFDETDRRLAELLCKHAAASVERIERERELERRAAELERKTERLDEFASIVSHDIRTPLSVAKGYLTIAREDGDAAAFEEVERALEDIEELTESMLSLAREGQSAVDPTPVRVGRLARTRWSSLETGDAILETDLDGDLLITADERRLTRIFDNLFRNSIEHAIDGVPTGRPADESADGTDSAADEAGDDAASAADESGDDAASVADESDNGPASAADESGEGAASADGEAAADPSLTVRVGPLEDGFYVEDDGPGIPDHVRERVLERGYSGGSGTGLGLAIVDEIVDAHGWDLAIVDGTDGGARFEVRGVDVRTAE